MPSKLVLVGDGGVGKTALVRFMRNQGFEQQYVATMGVEVKPVTIETKTSKIKLNCWDTAGQEKFGGLRDGYYIGADIAIIMFDVTARVTYRSVQTWHKDILRVCPNIPVILVGNKCDLERDRRVRRTDVTYPLPYFEISMRKNIGYQKLYNHIIKTLLESKLTTQIQTLESKLKKVRELQTNLKITDPDQKTIDLYLKTIFESVWESGDYTSTYYRVYVDKAWKTFKLEKAMEMWIQNYYEKETYDER